MFGIEVGSHGAKNALDAAGDENETAVGTDGKLTSLGDDREVEENVGFFAHALTIGALL